MTSSRRQFLALAGAGAAALPFAARGARPGPRRARLGPICVFSKHLQFLGFERLAETAAEIGFDGLDLTVRPGGHVRPQDAPDVLPRAADAARRAGLTMPMITTAVAGASPETDRLLGAAAAVGVEAYRMAYLRYHDGLHPISSLERHADALGDLAALNARHGLHGDYQNHAGTRVGGPVWDLWPLLDGRDPAHVGVQYDIRHATVEGGQAWPLGLRLVAPYVRSFVVKDFRWVPREGGGARLENVALGRGFVDWSRFFALVRELGLSGPVSVHYEYEMPGEDLPLEERRRRTVEVMRRDLTWLRRSLADAGLS